jgi:hypothetical protein
VTDRELLDLVRRGLRGDQGPPSATADCLDDDAVAALADGSLDAVTRAAVLPHVAGCGRCRAAVASVLTALADPAVARAVRAVEGASRWTRLSRWGVPAAAAAVAILLLSWPPAYQPPPHRAPTITAVPAPAPLSPVGEVAAAPLLRWAAVDGADRYRVTLFDAGGGVLYESELGDTLTALPDSVELTPGRRYLWKVEARTDFDRWVGSELVEFSIAGARR